MTEPTTKPSLHMDFWKATDEYLIMEPDIRKRLRQWVHHDSAVFKDGYAELITVSHAFNDLSGLTEKAIQAVLIKVLEYAAKVQVRDHVLHVGDLYGVREEIEVDGDKLIRENIFVPVKIV